MIPSQPNNLIPQPFAQNGNKQIVPDIKQASGRASFTLGFPTETQLPLNEGGVAPNRTDFNGMFYMLSAFAFWQQSGGMFTYTVSLSYATPAVVYHNNKLWWCVAPNGPDVEGVGTIEPGTNDVYWTEFIKALAGGSGGIGIPIGGLIMYYGTDAPEGFLPCDGSPFSITYYPKLYTLLGNTAMTPDFSGLVPRSYDPTAKVDPQGATRTIGSEQTDAGRNVTGTCDWQTNSNHDSGALYNDRTVPDGVVSRANSLGSHQLHLDASRVWGSAHTSTEFRCANFCILFCIKHD